MGEQTSDDCWNSTPGDQRVGATAPEKGVAEVPAEAAGRRREEGRPLQVEQASHPGM